MSKAWFAAVLLGGCAIEVGAGTAADHEADAEDPAQLDDVVEMIANNPDQPVPIEQAATVDADHDGIADATEELLLRRYRPYYKFSKDGSSDEDFRPANPVYELEAAQLKIAPANDTGTSGPLSGCGRTSDGHLAPAESLFDCRADASFLAKPAPSTYCLNIENARYGGVPFDQARDLATGLYGHVAPTTINGHDAYKIEYWQFFAFNNQDITIGGLGSMGDHEGDWTSVQLWFDRDLHRLVKTRYLIHGKEATFAIPASSPACHDCMIDLHGTNYNPNPPNFLEHPEAYTNNAAQFYVDDHRYKHPVVYIERGGHEFWPGAWGYAETSFGPLTFKLNPHNGAGPSFLVADLKTRLYNMGEVAHPLTRAGRFILQYNGMWGCTNAKEGGLFGGRRRSPVGPALHCSWRWPDRDPVAGCSN
jgi:hypothetical protein